MNPKTFFYEMRISKCGTVLAITVSSTRSSGSPLLSLRAIYLRVFAFSHTSCFICATLRLQQSRDDIHLIYNEARGGRLLLLLLDGGAGSCTRRKLTPMHAPHTAIILCDHRAHHVRTARAIN